MKIDLKQRYFKNLPWKFFRKLALMQIVVTSLMIVTTASIARYFLRTQISNQAQEQLAESLSFIERTYKSQNYSFEEFCQVLSAKGKSRFTLIKIDGTPFCDNHFPINELNNHLERPEVQEALSQTQGFSHRFSDTADSDYLYGARLVSDSSGKPSLIIRQAFPLEYLTDAMRTLDRSILLFIFPLLILTSLISLYGSLQVSSPLRSLLSKIEHMKNKSRHDGNALTFTTDGEQPDEWSLLERTLDRAKHDLENYFNELYIENEKINILMESISDCILAINLSEMILFANGQFRKNFVSLEFKKKDLREFKIWEIIRDSEIQNLFKEVMKNSGPKKIRNIQLDIKGGKARGFFDITISPMKDAENKVFGAVCVLHNVTDRKTAEQLREDFVTNVSHEVRTPLTALKGYVQLLKGSLAQTNSNPDVAQALNRIEANSDRLTLLFNDILQLSVIESKRKVDRQKLSTEEITSGVLANVKQSYLNKKIDVKLSFVCPHVYANAPLLEQVLTNLLDNAYKYTGENGHLEVEWNTEQNYYTLIIKDSGDQIPKQHHARLFERFYRVDPSRSRDQGGTGLGLAIVKHIIQKHYGSIAVGHNPEGGNFFKVKLPIKESFDSRQT